MFVVFFVHVASRRSCTEMGFHPYYFIKIKSGNDNSLFVGVEVIYCGKKLFKPIEIVNRTPIFARNPPL